MRAAALVVLAGCAAKAQAPAETPVYGSAIDTTSRREHVIKPETIVAPRPELPIASYIPDLHEELRWPLSPMTHPTAEPRFPIAAVFADPGVDWHELCARGVQHRNTGGRNVDESDYLRAWCLASSGDIESSAPILAHLLRSTVPDLSAAVRIDLATLIANSGNADVADHILAKAQIRDLPTLDTLAAMYIELGKDADAFEMTSRTLDASTVTTVGDRCQRLTRAIALGNDPLLFTQLDSLASTGKGKVPDPTCVRLHHAVVCHSAPGENCRDYFNDVQVDPDTATLVAAYVAWPDTGTWLDFLRIANMAFPLRTRPEGATLLRESLYVALRHGPTCQPDLMKLAYVAATDLKDTRLAAAIAECVAKP